MICLTIYQTPFKKNYCKLHLQKNNSFEDMAFYHIKTCRCSLLQMEYQLAMPSRQATWPSVQSPIHNYHLATVPSRPTYLQSWGQVIVS